MNYSKFMEISKEKIVERYNESHETQISVSDVFEVWYNQNAVKVRSMLSTAVSGDGMYYDLSYDERTDVLDLSTFKKISHKTIQVVRKNFDTKEFIELCKEYVSSFDDKAFDVEVRWHVKSLTTHKAVLYTIAGPRGLLFEMTYNGIINELYQDVYVMKNFNIYNLSSIDTHEVADAL